MSVNDLDIPLNATIRQEYVKCGNPDCQTSHGPYLYAYWKHDKKLRKLYVGKNSGFWIFYRLTWSHTLLYLVSDFY
ncbi:MAG: hypothetical protein WAM14_09545 [Candidatus Nitrosopolaris sp.]